jgi:integrase
MNEAPKDPSPAKISGHEPGALAPELADAGSGVRPTKLFDRVRDALRLRHMSIRTEQAYLSWIDQFLRYHRDKAGQWVHPLEMGSDEVNDFLTMLAVKRMVAANTQNQALSALLFLYSKVLEKDFRLDAVRAKRPERLPVVLTVDEVRRLLCAIPEGPLPACRRSRSRCGMGLAALRVCGKRFHGRPITALAVCLPRRDAQPRST